MALADKGPKRSGAAIATIARTHLVRVESKLDQLTALRDELTESLQNAPGEVQMAVVGFLVH